MFHASKGKNHSETIPEKEKTINPNLSPFDKNTGSTTFVMELAGS